MREDAPDTFLSTLAEVSAIRPAFLWTFASSIHTHTYRRADESKKKRVPLDTGTERREAEWLFAL